VKEIRRERGRKEEKEGREGERKRKKTTLPFKSLLLRGGNLCIVSLNKESSLD
jgi:hypothetical protein